MIYLQNERWVVEVSRRVKNSAGKTVRIRRRKTMPKGATKEQALAVSNRMDSEEVTRAMAVEGADGWEAYIAGLRSDPQSWLHVTLRRAKNRAKGCSYEFRLTADAVAEHMLRTKGRCEVTGLRFTTAGSEGSRKRPFFHSIDRIKPELGYTPNNIRIVCFAVNLAMLNWGEEVFAELARGFVFNRYSAFNVLRERG